MAASTPDILKFVSDDWIRWNPQWKDAWETADNTQICVSLVHSVFQTKVATAEEASERLCFVLGLADAQWTSTPVCNSFSELKRKALKVLAELGPLSDDIFGKELLCMTPEAAKQMFTFFRPKDGTENGGLASFETPKLERNFELRDHTAKKLNSKLLAWCEWVWTRGYAFESRYASGSRWPKNPLTIAVLDEKRVDILDILHAYGNGKLEELLDVTSVLDESEPGNLRCIERVQWELFTPECIQRLYELALRKSGLTGPLTRAEATEAALVAGSSAAKVLTLVNAAQRKLGLQR